MHKENREKSLELQGNICNFALRKIRYIRFPFMTMPHFFLLFFAILLFF